MNYALSIGVAMPATTEQVEHTRRLIQEAIDNRCQVDGCEVRETKWLELTPEQLTNHGYSADALNDTQKRHPDQPVVLVVGSAPLR